MEDNRVYVPVKLEPGNNTHKVDINYGIKTNRAFSLFRFLLKPQKQIFETEMIKEIEKFIKQPCLAQAVDLRDVFAISKFPGNSSLVSGSSMPSQAASSVACSTPFKAIEKKSGPAFFYTSQENILNYAEKIRLRQSLIWNIQYTKKILQDRLGKDTIPQRL